MDKDRNDEMPAAPDRARKPWFAPVLAVHSVSDVTRAGTTSCQNDGSTNFSPVS